MLKANNLDCPLNSLSCFFYLAPPTLSIIQDIDVFEEEESSQLFTCRLSLNLNLFNYFHDQIQVQCINF